MPAYPSNLNRTSPRPSTGGGGRGPIDREPFGGGGGGGGGRGDDNLPNYTRTLFRYRAALIVIVVSVAVLFTSTTVIFTARKWGGGHFDPMTGAVVPDWRPVPLPIQLLLLNTAVLLLSSVAAEKARRAAVLDSILVPATRIPGIVPERERATPWVYVTALLGLTFLAGQWMAWQNMHHHGIFLATGPASTFVFFLTGAHAVHLAGGILVLLFALVHQTRRDAVQSRRITLDVTAFYWHFMGALWIYILVLFHFMN
jgi:cytochrome c oxidase subunit III